MNSLEKFTKMLLAMAQGTVVSIEVFFLTLLFAIPLAMIICMGRMSKVFVLNKSIKFLLLIVRGTPLMLQLICVYFIPSMFLGLNLDRFLAAIIALSVNYACYFAEIYRSGISSIPVGQYEAANVLGYSKNQTFFKIILPQVIKRILPPVTNEVITLVKDTSLAQVIAVIETFTIAKQLANAQASMLPLICAGVYYYIFNFIDNIAHIKDSASFICKKQTAANRDATKKYRIVLI